jgi:hypothetical protein
MELSVNKLTSRHVNESELPVLTIFVANRLFSLVNSFTCQLVNLESYISKCNFLISYQEPGGCRQ